MSTPPPAQAFELGMHAALKAAGVKTAAEAETFFKIANDIAAHEQLQKRREDAFEIGARGVLSNAGVPVKEAQDALVKQALDLQGLLEGTKDTGGAVVDKTKKLGGAVAGKAKQLGGIAAGKAKPVIQKVKEKAPAVAGGLREFIRKRLKTIGIG